MDQQVGILHEGFVKAAGVAAAALAGSSLAAGCAEGLAVEVARRG